jgi:hypothetical protein
MKSAFIESPLGITKVVGDVNGISDISVLNEGENGYWNMKILLSSNHFFKLFLSYLIYMT